MHGVYTAVIAGTIMLTLTGFVTLEQVFILFSVSAAGMRVGNIK
ncbi:MAG: hypothetical protein V1722_05945 [Candidatus Micrarchaeota archaeon]